MCDQPPLHFFLDRHLQIPAQLFVQLSVNLLLSE
jgi:hypothetical protein